MRNPMPVLSRWCGLGVYLCAVLTIRQVSALATDQFGRDVALNEVRIVLDGRSVVDIEYDTVLGVSMLWVGTDSGAYVSTDAGESWTSFTTANGLNDNSISALLVQRDIVWLGVAHAEDIGGELYPVGDGFNFTTDGGSLWDAALPAQATGIGYYPEQVFGMLPYDMAGEPSGLWAACFFGGLIRSQDGGQAWFNIFPSAAARSDFEKKSFTDLSNRFFSVAAGSLDVAGDTIEIYAGSAGGINRFLVIDAKRKLAGVPVWEIQPSEFAAFNWITTGDGVSLASTMFPGQMRSVFDSTTGGALPRGMVRSMATGLPNPPFGGVSVFGVLEVVGADTMGVGLARTHDDGATWEYVDATPMQGPGCGAYDLMRTGSLLWAAAGDSGLQRSSDFGTSWQRILVDTLVTQSDSGQNRVHCLAYDQVGSQLYIGTYDGVYRLTLDVGGTVVAREPALYRYTPGDSTRAQAIRSLSAFRNGSGDLLLWAAAHTNLIDPVQRSASLYSNDSGSTWQSVRPGVVPWQHAYRDDTVFIATEAGLELVTLEGAPAVIASDTVVYVFRLSDSLEMLPPFRSVSSIGGIVWLGGDYGVARRVGPGIVSGGFDWEVYPYIPRDSVDWIELFEFEAGSDSTISGDFVIALEMQEHAGQRTVWASTRPVQAPQYIGVSRSTDHGRTWNVSLDGRIAWNFATYAEHVWAATSEGLFHTTDAGLTWDQIVIPLWPDTVEILSVCQIDDSTLFVGSEVGLGRSWNLGESWPTSVGDDPVVRPLEFRLEPNYPNPFNAGTNIRYMLSRPAHVNVTIYDVLGRVVTILLDAPSPAGEHVIGWDGRDRWGGTVGSGVYFVRLVVGESSAARRVLLLR